MNPDERTKLQMLADSIKASLREVATIREHCDLLLRENRDLTVHNARLLVRVAELESTREALIDSHAEIQAAVEALLKERPKPVFYTTSVVRH